MKKLYNWTVNAIWIIGIITLSAAAGHYMTSASPNAAVAQSASLITK